MGHLELTKVKDVSAFRKIAIGTWRDAYDPSVYGTMVVRMDAAMDYLARFREATGLRLTVSHMMAWAASRALERMPDANAILRFHRIYRRKRISVFFQVLMTDEGEGKADLSGATLHDVEKMSLVSIVTDFREKVERVRSRKDKDLERTRGSFRLVPFWLMHQVLRLISFLSYGLNIALPGMPKDVFGSIMITNIGSLGLDVAYVPLVPYSRVPMLLAIGAVKDEPVVDDGELAVGKVMRINATFDHRFIDGFHAAIMSKEIHRCFADPEAAFGSIEEAAAEAQAAGQTLG